MKKTMLIALAILLVAAMTAAFVACTPNDDQDLCANGHTWDDGTVTVPATEQSAGTMTYRCKVCGEERTETIPQLQPAHEHAKGTEHAEVPATCTQAGVAQYWDCEADDGVKLNAAGEVVTDTQLAIPALGHEYELDATAGTDGWTWSGTDSATAHFKCVRNCGETQDVTDDEIQSEVQPNGDTKYTAQVTGPDDETYTDVKTVPASHTEHTWQQPTWQWSGYDSATATFGCNGCEITQTVTATVGGADGNVITHSTTTAAKCETPGVETYTATVTGPDGETYTDDETKEIAATGHNYVLDESKDGGWTWNGYTEATAHFKCENSGCETPSRDVTATVTSTPGQAATCEGEGSTNHTAKATVPDKQDEKENTVVETLDPLGHDFTSPEVKVYKNNENGKHSAQCSRCDVFDAKEYDHVYTKAGAYTPTDGEQHVAKCDLCNATTTESCTSYEENDVCGKCKTDYREEVTVHFHLPESGWKASNIKAYSWYGADKSVEMVFGAFPGTGTFTAEGSNKWYKITFRVVRGHVNNDLYIIVSDKTDSGDRTPEGGIIYNGPQTGNVKVTAKEIWIPGLTGATDAYSSAELAEAAEKDAPGDSDWIITGNSFSDWADRSASWTNTFGQRNNYTLTFDFAVGDQFKLKRNGDEGWTYAIRADSKTRHTLTKEWTFDSAADTVITDGLGNDHNFKVLKACTVKFTLHYSSNDSAVTVDIIVQSVVGETHTHVKGTEHSAVPATCVSGGTKQYWDCKCGKKLDESGNVIDDVNTSPDPKAHNGVQQDAQAATHTQDGWEAYYQCEHCHKFAEQQDGEYTYESEQAIREAVKQAATGHTYTLDEQTPYTWTYSEGTTATVKVKFTCTCGETSEVEITLTDGEETAATCVSDRKVSFTLSKLAAEVKALATDAQDNDKFTDVSDTYTYTESGSATGHTYKVDKDFDSSENGLVWEADHKHAKLHLVCDSCEIETDGHTAELEFESDESNHDSNCTTPSSVTYTVTVDQAAATAAAQTQLQGSTVVIEDEKIEIKYTSEESKVLGHNWVLDETKGDKGFEWTVESADATEATVKVYLKCSREPDKTITLTFTQVTGTPTEATCTADKFTTFTLTKSAAEVAEAAQSQCRESVQDEDKYVELNSTKVETKAESKLPHTYAGEYYDDHNGNHYQKCSECGAENPEHTSHQWAEGYQYEDTQDAGHYQVCELCQAHSETAIHNYGDNLYDAGATVGHYQQCEDCSYTTDPVDHKWGTEYKGDDNDAAGHYQICEQCQGHSEKTAHTFSYTHDDSESEQHAVSCTVCHYKGGDENCEEYLEKDVCSRCHKDYRITVTVHYHRNTTWAGSNVYIWAFFSGSSSGNCIVEGEEPSMSAECKMDADSATGEGWFVKEVKYPRDVTRHVQFASTTTWTSQTSSETFTQNEIWCSMSGKVFATKEEALAEDAKGFPTKSNWQLAGLNDEWGDASTWDYVFYEDNDYTLTFDFNAGDTFKIKRPSPETWLGYSCKWSFVGRSTGVGRLDQIFKQGAANDNFEINSKVSCRLRITLVPETQCVLFYVESATGLGTDSGTKTIYLKGGMNGWGTDDPLKVEAPINLPSIEKTISNNVEWKLHRPTGENWWGIGCTITISFAEGVTQRNGYDTYFSGTDNIIMKGTHKVRITLDYNTGRFNIEIQS